MKKLETTLDELLTIQEMASKLKVKKAWLYERTRDPKSGLPYIRVGKHIRFSERAVREWLEKKQNQNSA